MLRVIAKSWNKINSNGAPSPIIGAKALAKEFSKRPDKVQIDVFSPDKEDISGLNKDELVTKVSKALNVSLDGFDATYSPNPKNTKEGTWRIRQPLGVDIS